MHNLHTSEEMTKTGIYKITCLSNNKIYIGSASSVRGCLSKVGFRVRLDTHIRELNKNIHKNHILQNSWNKYGFNNFKFEILEYCSPELCKEVEQKYLDTLKPFDSNGFNICKTSLINNPINKRNKSKNLNIKNRDSNLFNHLRVSIYQYDLKGNFIQEWMGITKVAKELGINRASIYNCCRGKTKHGGGFIWKYKNPNFIIVKQPKFNVKLTDLKTNIITIHPTLRSLEKLIGYCKSTISIHANSGHTLENRYMIEKIFI